MAVLGLLRFSAGSRRTTLFDAPTRTPRPATLVLLLSEPGDARRRVTTRDPRPALVSLVSGRTAARVAV